MNNKILKLYKITWIIAILFMAFYSDVSAIDVDSNNPNLITNCDEANVREDYYIPNGSNSLNIWYPVDYIWGINETLFIRNAESTVKIWNNDAWTLNCGSFVRSSNVVPAAAGKYYAIVSTDQCVISKKMKQDPSKPSAQIVYNVAYKRETWFQSGRSNYYYFKESDSTQYFLPNQTKRTWWPVEHSGNECYNIYAHWCGDGVQDAWQEQCDDGNNVDWDGCSATCTTEPEPEAVCTSLTASPNSWDAPLSSTVTCTWTDVTSYRIDCWDGNSVNAATWTCNYATAWNYTASCFVDGQVTTPTSCQKPVTVTPVVSTAVCNTLTVTPSTWDAPLSSTVTCSWTDVTTYRIDCWNGNSVNAATWNCNYPVVWTYTASCFVDWQATTTAWCQKPVTANTPLTRCWDGVIQSPNDAGQLETCDDGNLVNGDGCSSVCIIEPYVPSIVIDKTDGNPLDIDGILWTNDSQLIWSGSLSVFKITVTNNGTDDLTNLVITDAMSVKCGWSIPLPAFPVTFMSWSISGSGNHIDNIFQIWETIEYFCDSNTQAPYVNTASVNALGILSWNPVNDSDTSEVLLQLPTPVIDIVKNDNNPWDLDLDIWGNDSQTVNSGSLATFGIIVTNTGTEDLINVAITDPLVPACSRTVVETNAILQTIGNLDTVFDIGESFPYNCSDPIVTVNYTNVITVNAIGITSTTPVTDTDPSVVIVFIPPVVPVCTNLTVTPTSWSSVNRSYSCTWNLATSYNVVLTDTTWNTQSFSWSTGSFNLNTTGNYSASCFINGLTTTPLACTQTFSRSGWGGWWGSTSCLSWSFTRDAAICNGSSRAGFMKFQCDNWVILERPWNNVTFNRSECDFGLDPLLDTMSNTMKFSWAKCFASRNGTSWTTRWACQYDPGGWWGGPYCWDGVVQRPNSSWFMEECDNSASAWCNSDCTLQVVTRPWNVNIQIDNIYEHYVIGNTMDLYESHGWSNGNLKWPTVRNLSNNYDDDYYIPEICVYVKSWNSLEWDEKCETVGMLYSPLVEWEKNSHYYNWPFDYEWNTLWLRNRITQELNTVAYTLGEWSKNPIRWAFFEKTFDVTVVKPTISTTWGGTNYVNNENAWNLKEITNVKDTAWNVVVSKNYVWAWIWNDLSSNSKEVIDNVIVEKIKDEWDDLEENSDDIIESVTANDWINYNGMDNVYYVQTLNYIIDGSFDINKNPTDTSLTDTASKTYIIDGNVTINSDITGYPGSLAFIVKWGNITIWENVKNLQWTYIALPNSSWAKWKINGWGNSTNNVLHVTWSMYWDNSHLLSKRTYIKNNSHGQIDVGTIVSFGSSIFRKPAPLTTKFLNDYLEATKVAQ